MFWRIGLQQTRPIGRNRLDHLLRRRTRSLYTLFVRQEGFRLVLYILLPYA